MRAHLLAAALLTAGLLGGHGAKADPDNFTEVERGRYLATAGDCMACHIGADGKSMAGGHRLETPFGAIAVPNLTPDDETGIGRWTSNQFWRAMHEGIGAHGERLYPAFPYTAFTKMPREDVDAVYAYLRTLEPVRNAVDRDTLPFPFNIRLLMAGWNMLNFTPGVFQPDPAKSAEFNRGAYLVEGPGHCGLCHTPRNLIGGDKSGAHLQGGELQGWFAPNITADKRQGIGDWSDAEMVEYLRTGRNARTAASGPMAEVVAYSTSAMTDADLKAIAVYLRERGAAGDPAPAALAAGDAHMTTGAAVFQDSCSACHVGNGEGVAGMFPRLANSQVVQQTNPTTVIRVILDGAQSVATPTAVTAPAMPAFHWRMTDQQVADVSTYIRNSWGNAAPAVTVDQVRKVREELGER
ncbi:cytochrome c [Roseomonas haemaphysalidis]|uniref:Cytochrome c n=1 Tax=Roseomonas haemaphysalidis TaxID=2768162 RepID=A0ABS3KMP6_9PROT|nr:cytochrome c [Roseomonas haemaphysalidis]MBO1078743.1 cytochrome c [Roseomonas haemaphysalidis]